jgi:hypothetical protein
MHKRTVRVVTLRQFNDRRVRLQPGRRLYMPAEKAHRLIAQHNVRLLSAPKVTPAAVIVRGAGFPVNPYSTIGRIWEGETVVIIGGGPSLTRDDVEYCRGKARIIAINNTYLLAPWADIVYFADARWYSWHKTRAEFKALPGPLVTIENGGLPKADARVHCLRVGRPQGLSTKPDTLHTGSNSGFQSVNLCYLAGVRRIVLLGFDMRAVNKRTHWHPGHPVRTPETVYARLMVPRMKTALPQLHAAGIEVINATPGSALRLFKMGTLQNALKAD